MRRIAVLVAVFALGLAAQARASNVTSLGALIPMGLNSSDQVVGDVFDTSSSSSSSHAALWSGGSLQMLSQLSAGDESDAYAISASGRIAGDDYGSTSSVHGVYWNGGGTANQVGPFNGVDPSSEFTVLNGVDNAGDLAGVTPLSSTNYSTTGFLYQGGSEVEVGQSDLRGQPGGTAVGGITPDGSTMLGSVTTGSGTGYYLWSSASPSGPGAALSITPPRNDAIGLDGAEFGTEINDDLASDGTVLGYTGSRKSGTNFIRLPDGTLTPVNGLYHANAVNASHVVVGSILGPSMSDPLHAAVWANGTVTDLNTLLPQGSGWELVDALAINDSGDIVGIGVYNGQQVGFLLTAGERQSTTTVQCVPSSSPPFTCTATVSDSSGQSPPQVPTGAVSFSATVGALSPQSCTLVAVSGSSAACSVGLTPSTETSTSPTQITATYPGDPHFTQSVGTTTLHDLVLTMSDDPAQVGAGWQDTYTITVTNVGPAVTNVPVTDALPPQVVYLSGGGTQATCVRPRPNGDPHLGGSPAACTIPAISQNGSVTFTITTSVDNASEPFDNTAVVNPTRTIVETNYSNDSQDVETQIPLPQGQGWQVTWQMLQDRLGRSDLKKLLTGAAKSSQCVSYQTEILQRLDALRQSDPFAALRGLSYGPITDQGHNGVVVYLQGTSYFDTGVVIHGTAAPSGYDLPGRDLYDPSNGWTGLTGTFMVTPITDWQALERSVLGEKPVHEVDDDYGYYFEGTYPATGTYIGNSSAVTCPIAPKAMVVSTRSPVEIHLVNSAGQQLQTQAGALSVDQFSSRIIWYLGLDPAGNFDWDLVLPVDRYKVTLVGTATGPYTLILTGFTAKGTPIQTTYHGRTTAGQTTTGLSFVPPLDVVNRFGLSVARSGDRIVLKVNAPGSGSIVAKAQTTVPAARTSGRAHGKHTSRRRRTISYGKASATVARGRRVRLVIRPGKAGRALSREGPIRISITITFSPTGGLPRTKHRSVTVKPARPRTTRS